MDIFSLDGESPFYGFLMQFLEFRQQLRELLCRQQSYLGQHRNVRHRPQDVPRGQHQVQFAVLPDRKRIDLRCVVKSFRPNFHIGIYRITNWFNKFT